MIIKDVIDRLADYEYLKVPIELPVSRLKDLVLKNRGIRSIYVEDNDGKVIGEVSLGRLINAVTAKRRCSARLSARSLLSCITPRHVRDIMDAKVISARLDEDVEDVLMRFIRSNIKEMPVLDQERRIIKNIGVLDLWEVIEN